MKNFTETRKELKRRGYGRCDRASGPNISNELWRPPWDGIGFQPQSISFEDACKREELDPKK